MDIYKIIEFRHQLHQIAELSGNEVNTSEFIYSFLEDQNPDMIIKDIGGYGLAAIFEGNSEGPVIVFRAELDALPIPETITMDYESITPGVSHKCGHDGHMSVLAGLAVSLNMMKKNFSGKIILLFQPSEETGVGAAAVVNDPKFNYLEPDYIFALHNIPGYPKSGIIIKNGIFASASKGLIIKLTGEESHAALPELGRSPVLSMINIIEGLQAIPQVYTSFNNSANITIIHSRLGKRAFGTSPGDAEVMATFRAQTGEDMGILTQKAEKLVMGVSQIYQLDYELEWVDDFPITVNDPGCVEIIKSAAEKFNKEIISPERPFPWSEDFGVFTNQIKGAIFGLGAGESHPQIHSPEYDFPDELIKDGIDIFTEIMKQLTSVKI